MSLMGSLFFLQAMEEVEKWGMKEESEQDNGKSEGD